MLTAEERKELCAMLRAHQFGSAADEIEELHDERMRLWQEIERVRRMLVALIGQLP